MTGQIILFLLFMGAEKVVNRRAGLSLMNGARWYLFTVPILFIVELVARFASVPASMDSQMQAEVYGRIVGGTLGAFLLPVGAALYYSSRFTKAREAATKAASQLAQ